jgi:hypothetical protein
MLTFLLANTLTQYNLSNLIKMFEIFRQPSVSQALPNKQTPGNTIRQSAFLTVDVVDS